MKYLLFIFIALTFQPVLAYEGPNPLKDLSVNVRVAQNPAGLFTYEISVVNPKSNNGAIDSIDVFLGQDAGSNSAQSTHFSHCSAYFKTSSENNLEFHPATGVGSTAPGNWSCGYGLLAGFDEISYGWGARNDAAVITPGTSKSGFSLVSNGLPAVREILIQPSIDLERLPQTYRENANKIEELERKLQWMGKTLGPRTPPSVFVPEDFADYLISIEDEAVSLGWIKNNGIAKSLNAKLKEAKAKIHAGERKAAKGILKAFQSEVKAQSGKHISLEGDALLYYNAKYLAEHL